MVSITSKLSLTSSSVLWSLSCYLMLFMLSWMRLLQCFRSTSNSVRIPGRIGFPYFHELVVHQNIIAHSVPNLSFKQWNKASALFMSKLWIWLHRTCGVCPWPVLSPSCVLLSQQGLDLSRTKWSRALVNCHPLSLHTKTQGAQGREQELAPRGEWTAQCKPRKRQRRGLCRLFSGKPTPVLVMKAEVQAMAYGRGRYWWWCLVLRSYPLGVLECSLISGTCWVASRKPLNSAICQVKAHFR